MKTLKSVNKKMTAINRIGKKIKYNNYIFDSEREYLFYKTYIETSGYTYDIHKKFDLLEKFSIQGKLNIRSISYRPDFVIYNKDGSIKHVYDVKNGYSVYDIDRGNNLIFKLFEKKYNIPVEIAVVRKTFFRTKILGSTKRLNPIKKTDIDYDWFNLLDN